MYSFKPIMTDRSAFEELLTMIVPRMVEDPEKALSLKGGHGLIEKLKTSIFDIANSIAFADAVSLTDDEAIAFLYFIRLFAEERPRSPCLHVFLNYSIELNNHVKNSSGLRYRTSGSILRLMSPVHNRIFVVYGRDRTSFLELHKWLKSFNLDVVSLEPGEVEGTRTVAETLEETISTCGTGIVVATSDDLGGLKENVLKNGEVVVNNLKCRVRQNVILEMGMLWSFIGIKRIIVIVQEDSLDDFPTDMGGFFTLRFSRNISEIFDQLRQRLQIMEVITPIMKKK